MVFSMVSETTDCIQLWKATKKMTRLMVRRAQRGILTSETTITPHPSKDLTFLPPSITVQETSTTTISHRPMNPLPCTSTSCVDHYRSPSPDIALIVYRPLLNPYHHLLMPLVSSDSTLS